MDLTDNEQKVLRYLHDRVEKFIGDKAITIQRVASLVAACSSSGFISGGNLNLYSLMEPEEAVVACRGLISNRKFIFIGKLFYQSLYSFLLPIQKLWNQHIGT